MMNSSPGVFVIDDDPVILFQTATVLKKHFPATAEITKFNDPLLALSFLEGNNTASEALPNFIFVDFHMPGINGIEFLRKVAELPLPKNFKAFVITSSMDPDEISAIEQLQHTLGIFVAYLQKPLKNEHIEGFGFTA